MILFNFKKYKIFPFWIFEFDKIVNPISPFNVFIFEGLFFEAKIKFILSYSIFFFFSFLNINFSEETKPILKY